MVLRASDFHWGIEDRWVDGASLPVSDPERTIVDALHLPRHVGGVEEVASVLAGAWRTLDQPRLLQAARRCGYGSVIRRLGLLVETMALAGAAEFGESLRALLPSTRTAVLLDPTLPREGQLDRRWGIRLNIDQSEIEGAGRT